MFALDPLGFSLLCSEVALGAVSVAFVVELIEDLLGSCGCLFEVLGFFDSSIVVLTVLLIRFCSGLIAGVFGCDEVGFSTGGLDLLCCGFS